MATVSHHREPVVDEFVSALKRRMSETDTNPTDLAKKAKVGRPYLYRVLAGDQSPSLDWAAKVGRAIGLKIRTTKA
jgi:DNA-binding phage protein